MRLLFGCHAIDARAIIVPGTLIRWWHRFEDHADEHGKRGDADREKVLFTSSIQLDHLMTIAHCLGLQSEVSNALREFTALASVRPVMTATLEAAGLPVDIVPAHPKMAALVKAASDITQAVLVRKREMFDIAGYPNLFESPRSKPFTGYPCVEMDREYL
jgi:hypothetical protein